MSRHNQISLSVRRILALTVAILAVQAIAVSSAGASGDCGELSFGFDGTRLLNDGISNSAGPFAAEIPAGTYTVTLVSHDHHLSQPDDPSQTGEQFRVVLDSGYRSALSLDIPDDSDTATTVLTGQQIDTSTTISVRHGEAPGINSVDVVCVGFTPEVPAIEQLPEPVETDPTPVTEPVPVVEEPYADDPYVEEPPTQDIGEPVTLVRDPAPDTEVESLQVTPAQVPQLAITGPSRSLVLLVALAVGLLGTGAVLLQRERRLSVER